VVNGGILFSAVVRSAGHAPGNNVAKADGVRDSLALLYRLQLRPVNNILLASCPPLPLFDAIYRVCSTMAPFHY
jgi:hypothetical protein